ncbi:hypothetical protein BA895_16955 [Humibacillus sp. DSM 29435]|uniref:hypothetical protein n=1 Tax=Humibacillus sp. DSM 29435 TaxID=1869167 RepID=UPI000872D883|nr:hypothetical protein [Humibacillus sp. DSM 29435]OFE17157.1 hypothetical protein BA895_16955 [Humibacillus sp. DSM 29435]
MDALYEYERTTDDRVKTRVEDRSTQDRQELRQLAWSGNGRVRAAIATLALLSADTSLSDKFESVRIAIGELNQVASLDDLKARHEAIYSDLAAAIELARSDVTN